MPWVAAALVGTGAERRSLWAVEGWLAVLAETNLKEACRAQTWLISCWEGTSHASCWRGLLKINWCVGWGWPYLCWQSLFCRSLRTVAWGSLAAGEDGAWPACLFLTSCSLVTCALSPELVCMSCASGKTYLCTCRLWRLLYICLRSWQGGLTVWLIALVTAEKSVWLLFSLQPCEWKHLESSLQTFSQLALGGRSGGIFFLQGWVFLPLIYWGIFPVRRLGIPVAAAPDVLDVPTTASPMGCRAALVC